MTQNIKQEQYNEGHSTFRFAMSLDRINILQ
jgi:hypothetical protein